MALSGVETPKMEWSGENLRENWRRFKQHAELMFTGPLKTRTRQKSAAIFSSGAARKVEISSTHGEIYQKKTR